MSLRAAEVFAPRCKRGKPELAVQKAIVAWLRARGCLVAVTDAGAAYRAGAFFGDAIPAGWPDITGLLSDGRFIGVEVKSPACPERSRRGGRQSPLQKHIEQEIRRRNGVYILARSVEDVQSALERKEA